MSSTPAKRPPLPAILLANDLLDGDVVFRTAEGWTRDPAGALVARDDDTANALEAAGKAEFDARKVVDVYLVDVAIDADGVPVPKHFRERFKTLGPPTGPISASKPSSGGIDVSL